MPMGTKTTLCSLLSARVRFGRALKQNAFTVEWTSFLVHPSALRCPFDRIMLVAARIVGHCWLGILTQMASLMRFRIHPLLGHLGMGGIAHNKVAFVGCCPHYWHCTKTHMDRMAVDHHIVGVVVVVAVDWYTSGMASMVMMIQSNWVLRSSRRQLVDLDLD